MLDHHAHHADAMGMLEPGLRPPELLAFCKDGLGLDGLRVALEREGIRLEIVANLNEVRQSFFRSGGHKMLILGPDLSPALARAAVDSLHGLDPSLDIVIFGLELTRHEFLGHITRVPAFHPSSRAGVGAILKVMKTHC